MKLIIALALLVSCSHFKTPDRDTPRGLDVAWVKNQDTDFQSGNLPIALNSPLIEEGLVFVGHNDGHMMAYEVETGRKVWRKKDGDHNLYNGTPLFYNDQVIYGTNTGRLFSRHYLTGESKYMIDLGSSIDGKGVVYKDRLFFHLRNHKIFCLDAKTGKVLWAYRRPVPFKLLITYYIRPPLRVLLVC
jgi:outer membrane protein assembly factor BamB